MKRKLNQINVLMNNLQYIVQNPGYIPSLIVLYLCEVLAIYQGQGLLLEQDFNELQQIYSSLREFVDHVIYVLNAHGFNEEYNKHWDGAVINLTLLVYAFWCH